ncbi:hypothetical protein Ahy_A07g033014 [Arachis hypogaea]|uniref:Uncharacterized protein n=1 Tax=Arachis hypogaea TaxID=3818 RepID=A0A445C818_ARAHY|nr:hypothetical protein Ahy_A07g033014 [Arachis hypogaea]
MFDIYGRIMAEQVMEISAEDGPPFTPKPLHVASRVEDMDVNGEDFDEEYVADSNESGSSEDDDEEEFVLEISVEASRWYLLPAPHPILALLSVPSLDVHRVGRVHMCLAPTMSQDHQKLDNRLICRVTLPLIQSSPSVSVSMLQGATKQSYHFKFSYRKVWMEKQKAIA